jgi:hypothetical protein
MNVRPLHDRVVKGAIYARDEPSTAVLDAKFLLRTPTGLFAMAAIKG